MNDQTMIETAPELLHSEARLLTTEQAAAYLGLAKNTLEKARCGCADGPFFIKMGSRTVRYARDDLDAWIAKHRAATTSEVEERARQRLTCKSRSIAR